MSVGDLSEELTCEIAVAALNISKTNITIIGVYRPPQANLEDALRILSQVLEQTEPHKSSVVLVGDINIDCLKVHKSKNRFEETLAAYNFNRLNLPPTRITYHSASSIDCVCTNFPIESLKVHILDTGLSDHKGQLCVLDITTEQPRQTSQIRRQINVNTLNHLKLGLAQQMWTEVYSTISADEAYNNLLNTMTMEINAACPLKKLRQRKSKTYVNYNDIEITQLKQDYLQLLRMYELTGLERNRSAMASKKKQYDLRLRKLRQESAANHIQQSSNKSKAAWEIVNSERATKRGEKNNPLIKLITEGKTIEKPEDIVEELNTYFSNIAEDTLRAASNLNQPSTRVTTPRPRLTQTKLILTDTTVREVEEIISSLKNKTSSGLDEISAKLVKHCAETIIAPLVDVINKSFKSGIFPSALKVSKVYPKLKKGVSTNLSNYRPISIIPTFSKIFEKIVLKRLIDHLTQLDLLTNCQHGFLKGRSTATALTDLVEFIIDHIDKGKYTTAVLLDYSKAFDCLSHDIILDKLEALGVQETAKHWFESYLRGRSQLVELSYMENGVTRTVKSKLRSIERGVPQGSVLGPVLFILLTNDFPDYIKDYSSVVMYADDTTLLLKGDTPEDISISAYIALNMTYDYCLTNNLVANPSKTKQINFSRRGEQIPALPDIDLADQTDLLGLTLDSNLTWGPHVDILCKKLNSALYVIRRIKCISNIEAAKMAYFALFETYLRYGIVVWGGTSTTNLNRILTIQKSAIRSIANLKARDSCREEFKNLKIKTVISIYIQAVILHVDKLGLPKETRLHFHDTRHSSRIPVARHRTALYERKPSFIGAKLYNHLPADFKLLTGEALKHRLSSWLTDNPVYSIEEFLDKTKDSGLNLRT
uniref:Reverse transcriptase domain-containing protein n=1 Tax=Homalodisca liturata TaxID=320908 RepID=A0A1B6K0F4_9HEMI